MRGSSFYSFMKKEPFLSKKSRVFQARADSIFERLCWPFCRRKTNGKIKCKPCFAFLCSVFSAFLHDLKTIVVKMLHI